MSPNPQHGNPAGDATIAIRQLARQTGSDVQDLQTLYVLEALLARLTVSGSRQDFVLKGGVLLAAYSARRPTRDIDLQATRLSHDRAETTGRLRQIAALDLADGVVFDTESVTTSAIRSTDESPGIRIKLVGALGRSRLTIGIDVNFGDPILPPPQAIELPRVVEIGHPPIRLLGYPLSMVLAEKIVTAIDRGEANTRWRDFADVYTLIHAHSVDVGEFKTSLDVVAAYRRVELRPLLPLLAGMPQRAQGKWLAWRRRAGREHELPEDFTDVLDSCSGFADAFLTGPTSGKLER